ncbi:MAG: NACHT domain-containing protein, partial [Anaerolineae bacterium]|nr:NACHT domain-containing protein [Anaerolineae bacterium]
MGNIDTNGNNNVIGSTNIQVSGSGAIVTRFFQGKAEQRAQRERHAMLELVRTIWVEGVLEKSLYAEILTRLGLEEQPGACERPWDVLLQTPDQPNRMLPPGTPVVEVFDAVNGSLLILGEPGAGKTTMLLELVRDTLVRAEQDAALPIPVVFNLSSWTDPQQPLTDWLIAELRAKYYAPKATAQRWVERGELLLLLDGLDEVRPENREACIQA